VLGQILAMTDRGQVAAMGANVPIR
jgi:hypothetical protein